MLLTAADSEQASLASFLIVLCALRTAFCFSARGRVTFTRSKRRARTQGAALCSTS